MKLTKKAISKIQDRNTLLTLAIALNFSEQWIKQVVAANKDNGPLTTAKALETIRQETKLSDAEILEESEVKEKTI